MELLVEAELDGGEVVVAAAEGEAFPGDGGVVAGEEVEDGRGGHGGLAVEAGELGGDGDAVRGAAG